MNTTEPPDEGLSLVEYINLHRERKSLDWGQVAAALQVSNATLYRWRQNAFVEARVHHLHMLVDLLDLDARRVLDLVRAA
jgi:predicted transcriptional regulator